MAKDLKLTQTLTGWFDVRVYNERIARENRQIKGENDNIGFSATFAAGDPAAVAFATYGKPYADANGNPRLRVNFKIGRKAGGYRLLVPAEQGIFYIVKKSFFCDSHFFYQRRV